MPQDLEDPRIVYALGVRRQVITHLEAISPNVQVLDQKPDLPVRLAACFREGARLLMAAVHRLEEPDEETEG